MDQVPANDATQIFYEDVVRQNSLAFFEVPCQYRTATVCMMAINNSGMSFGSVLCDIPYEIQTEKMILAAIDVHEGPDALEGAAFQTRDICIAAIEKNPQDILWIDDQTPDICEMAIRISKKKGIGVRYVVESIRIHTPELCMFVARNIPTAINLLRTQQREVCLEAIRSAHIEDVKWVLSEVREQFLEVSLAAYRRSRPSYQSIRDAKLRRCVVRLILAEEIFIPLRDTNLSTSLLTEVADCLMEDKFPPMLWKNPQVLTPTQMWALAAKVKHTK
ncbi:MAG: hypothetical protein WC052_04460 [Patescibacteria group bacterium]